MILSTWAQVLAPLANDTVGSDIYFVVAIVYPVLSLCGYLIVVVVLMAAHERPERSEVATFVISLLSVMTMVVVLVGLFGWTIASAPGLILSLSFMVGATVRKAPSR